MGELNPTVFVIDGDPAVRDSLSALIAMMGIRVATFASAEEFLGATDGAEAGCVVVEYRLPGMNGLELVELLGKRGDGLKVIVIAGPADVALAVRAMKAGAVDFVEKLCKTDDLQRRILRAIRLDILERQAQRKRKGVEQCLAKLTAEERLVMDMMVSGASNQEIADQLAVGLRTVHTRRARVFEKMQVTSRPELLQKVVKFVTTQELPAASP